MMQRWAPLRVQTYQLCIFTNTYTADNTEDNEDHGEFSDDNTKWDAADEEWVVREIMQGRIDDFFEWCKENNVEATKSKTKFMVFRPKKSARPYNKIRLYLNGEEIDEVEATKILGTTLDNQLSFTNHFEKAVKSGYATLNQLKRFTAEQEIKTLLHYTRPW